MMEDIIVQRNINSHREMHQRKFVVKKPVTENILLKYKFIEIYDFFS